MTQQFKKIETIANHPVLEDVHRLCNEIEEAEKKLRRVKEQLHEAVAELPAKIGENADLREEIVYHLYWFDDRVPKNTLKKAFNVVPPANAGKKAKNVIRPAQIQRTCRDCQQLYQSEANSHSDKRWNWGVCDDCQAKRDQSHEEYKQQEALRQKHIRELATMPYAEYLQTPEWAERRRRAMKRSGFRCQVCNSYGVQLNTHHRTYERRGNERDSDLITLCRACHEIFHENGQLAEEEAQA